MLLLDGGGVGDRACLYGSSIFVGSSGAALILAEDPDFTLPPQKGVQVFPATFLARLSRRR